MNASPLQMPSHAEPEPDNTSSGGVAKFRPPGITLYRLPPALRPLPSAFRLLPPAFRTPTLEIRTPDHFLILRSSLRLRLPRILSCTMRRQKPETVQLQQLLPACLIV